MKSHPRIAAGGISLLIYLVIFSFSSLPAGSLPTRVPDFIPHVLEYFALAIFLVQVFPKPGRGAGLAAALATLAVLGMADEVHQLAVPGRVFSFWDWLYDMLGAAGGVAAFRWLERDVSSARGGWLANRLKFILLQR